VKKLILAFIYLLLAIPCQAQVIYVDADATGANNGSTWTDAYNYLQDGLTAAVANDEVWVAQGIYTPDSSSAVPGDTGDRTATFQLKNNVALYGGFPAGGGAWQQRDPNTYKTILSGDLDENDVYVNDPCDLLTEPTRAENSYHVVTGSGTDSIAILDGFTITAGNANGGSWPDDCGGGMHNNSGSPTVTNCTFSSNSAGRGGGIKNRQSSPTLIDCNLVGNSATYGGGMHNTGNSSPYIRNCTFKENSSYNGAGISNYSGSNVFLIRCVFSNNMADNAGGGMRNWQSCPEVISCTFTDNFAGHSGAGIVNFSCGGGNFVNCRIVGNFTPSAGGGGIRNDKSSVTVTNCTLMGNSAKNGGGIKNHLNSSIVLTNCTLSGNYANRGGGLFTTENSYSQLKNCIFWNNSATKGAEINIGNSKEPSTLAVSHSDIKGGQTQLYIDPNCVLYWELGNIEVDPCFVEAGQWVDVNDPNVIVEPNDPNAVWINGDYHLKSEGWSWDIKRNRWTYDDVTSRCIDAGNPGSPLADEPVTIPDDPNNIWGQNLRINMGAFGGTAEASMPPYGWAILGDLTNDGLVNLKDYAFQAADWLNSADQQSGDLNRDSLIDIDDLALLVEVWLRQTTWY